MRVPNHRSGWFTWVCAGRTYPCSSAMNSVPSVAARARRIASSFASEPELTRYTTERGSGKLRASRSEYAASSE